jgi:capsular polysaccharide transport system permease protein
MSSSPNPDGAPDLSRLRSVHAQVPRAATLRTITALVLREMAATYGRSPGGYIWAVLEPALGLALLVMIFSLGFRTPPLGTNFGIFYASGLLPFFMFTTTVLKVQMSVRYSKNLLAYPRVTFLDTLLARFVLNVITQGLVSYIIFFVILGFYDTRTILDFGRLLNAYAMAAALGLGVGAMNCLLIARHPIWGSVWSVITRPLLLLSGVIFLHDKIPEPYRSWLEWNPLVHVVGESRRAFYYSYTGSYVNPVYTYGVAGLCLLVGLLFLNSYHRDLMER